MQALCVHEDVCQCDNVLVAELLKHAELSYAAKVDATGEGFFPHTFDSDGSSCEGVAVQSDFGEPAAAKLAHKLVSLQLLRAGLVFRPGHVEA